MVSQIYDSARFAISIPAFRSKSSSFWQLFEDTGDGSWAKHSHPKGNVTKIYTAAQTLSTVIVAAVFGSS
jgi:hypothetical protein